MNLPIIYQRLEGLVIGLIATILYFYFGYEMVWFLTLLLLVDVFMLGYLINSRLGAHIYNLGHSLFIPAIGILIGAMIEQSIISGLALIWLAHIGFDRALGYGLKFPDNFKHTHLS